MMKTNRSSVPKKTLATSSSGLFRVAIAVVFFAALLIRYRSALGDLWLDEIWSLKMALSVGSAIEILSKIHHDNNHYINTFVFYILGDGVEGLYYRIPSCLAGLASVVVAAMCINTKDNVEKMSTALVFCFSYWLIHYSSEARGYSYLCLFVLLSYYFIQKYLAEPDRKKLILFNVAVILGFLSHLTFIHMYVALGAWVVFKWHQEKKDTDQIVKDSIVLFGPSAFFLLVLYVADLRFLQIGGGDTQPVWNIIFETIGWTIGAGVDNLRIAISVIVVLAVSGCALIQFKKDKNASFFLCLVGVLVSPALFILITQPPFLYPRYFVVSSVLFLLLFARQLAEWLRTGGVYRIGTVILAILLLALNISTTLELWRTGRGNYSAALNKILTDSRDPKLSVGSDHDFRNTTVIGYYSRHFPQGKTISYFPKGSWTNTEPEWLLYHQFDPTLAPRAEFNEEQTGHFRLEEFYPSSRLSGWSWALYHRVP